MGFAGRKTDVLGGLKIYPVSMMMMMMMWMEVTVDKFKTFPLSCTKTGQGIYLKKSITIGYNYTQTW